MCLIFNLTESNPYNMKQRIEKECAMGSGNWFDNNMFEFEFNIQTKKFHLVGSMPRPNLWLGKWRSAALEYPYKHL